MATKDIDLVGTVYQDVPAVDLPQDGGGTARFVEISDTTATASDVSDGDVFYTSGGTRTVGNAKYAGAPVNNGNATATNGILYGTVDNTSTSTAFTATVSGLTSYYDGVCVLLKNGVITSAAGFTIDINSLGAKPVYTNMAAATAETTKFNVNYTMLFVYDSTRVAGGCWLCYNGYDSNTNTIGYQLRSNSYTLPASDKGYKYRLWFTSADGSKFVPANKSSSSNATASRTPNTTPIDPFGKIVYNSTNGSVDANANLPTGTLWEQYTLSLGYSFNTTGAALTMSYPAPVYIKCTPTSGGATLDGYVQALPSTADGKIYIFLGVAYSATSIELLPNHPVYEYKDGAVRLYTNAASGGSSVDPATATPLMDGTAAVGTATKYAREDHVHPTDTGRAAASHDHGNITSGGDITTNATIASGDRLVINDESASKVANSSITFGSSTTQFLANNGTWQTPSGGGSTDYNDLTFDPDDYTDLPNFGVLPEIAQESFQDIASMSDFMDWLFYWLDPNSWQ